MIKLVFYTTTRPTMKCGNRHTSAVVSGLVRPLGYERCYSLWNKWQLTENYIVIRVYSIIRGQTLCNTVRSHFRGNVKQI